MNENMNLEIKRVRVLGEYPDGIYWIFRDYRSDFRNIKRKKKKNPVGHVRWKSNEADWLLFNHTRFPKLMIQHLESLVDKKNVTKNFLTSQIVCKGKWRIFFRIFPFYCKVTWSSKLYACPFGIQFCLCS